jgi:hypothetical protein
MPLFAIDADCRLPFSPPCRWLPPPPCRRRHAAAIAAILFRHFFHAAMIFIFAISFSAAFMPIRFSLPYADSATLTLLFAAAAFYAIFRHAASLCFSLMPRFRCRHAAIRDPAARMLIFSPAAFDAAFRCFQLIFSPLSMPLLFSIFAFDARWPRDCRCLIRADC